MPGRGHLPACQRRCQTCGNRIRLSVKDRKLDLLVPEDEMARRRAAWQPAPAPKRGWDKLVYDQVTQAPLGADLAFLRAAPRLR